MNTQPTFTVVIANKSDKKSIKRFYKRINAPFSYMGIDTVFLVKKIQRQTQKENIQTSTDINTNTHIPVIGEFSEHIIGGVVLSQLNSDNHQYLLHALFIDENHRKKGLSTLLLKSVKDFIQEHNNQKTKADLACILPKNKLTSALADVENTIEETKTLEIIAFAHTSLTSFYQQQGYNKVFSESLQAPLYTRYKSYLKQQPDLTIFQFQA